MGPRTLLGPALELEHLGGFSDIPEHRGFTTKRLAHLCWSPPRQRGIRSDAKWSTWKRFDRERWKPRSHRCSKVADLSWRCRLPLRLDPIMQNGRQLRFAIPEQNPAIRRWQGAVRYSRPLLLAEVIDERHRVRRSYAGYVVQTGTLQTGGCLGSGFFRMTRSPPRSRR